MVEFTVYCKLHGKERPRMVVKGNKRWTYTPKKTKETEKIIAESAKEFFKVPFSAPVYLNLKFYKRSTKPGFLLKKPDLDNLIKLVMDALNGIAYLDDSQVVQINATKKTTTDQDKIKIKITEKCEQ